MKRALAIILVIVLMGLLISCDKGSDGGGGGSGDTAISITGNNRLGNGATGTYTAVVTTSEVTIAEYQWQIEGSGKIAKNEGSTITVTATGQGAIKILLRVKDAKGNWSEWAEKKVPISAVPTFIVEAVVGPGGSFTGSPATGSSAIWLATGNDLGGGAFDFLGSNYTIRFSGDVSGLPKTVLVTVAWTSATGNAFVWGTTNDFTGIETFNIARQSGGTIGGSGPDRRPYLFWNNPVGTTLGTVKFSAPGVQTLTLTVKNAN